VTDAELVVLAKAGDAGAFDQLVARHQSAAYRAAMSALRNAHDAEEVAQDALVKAWVNLGRFRGDSSFRTWLLTIVWNVAMSRRRSIARWFTRAVPLDVAAEVPERSVGPHGEASYHETRALVVTAIEGLSPKLRDALLLAQSGDYGYDEIAVILTIPVGTVKWRVSEARKQVKAWIATHSTR